MRSLDGEENKGMIKEDKEREEDGRQEREEDGRQERDEMLEREREGNEKKK